MNTSQVPKYFYVPFHVLKLWAFLVCYPHPLFMPNVLACVLIESPERQVDSFLSFNAE